MCIRDRLNEVNERAVKAYKEYRFADITNMLSNLMTNELSAYYMDYTKDILYIEKKDSLRRRQVQTVLWHAINVLVRLWAPILVHTCEAVSYTHLSTNISCLQKTQTGLPPYMNRTRMLVKL